MASKQEDHVQFVVGHRPVLNNMITVYPHPSVGSIPRDALHPVMSGDSDRKFGGSRSVAFPKPY